MKNRKNAQAAQSQLTLHYNQKLYYDRELRMIRTQTNSKPVSYCASSLFSTSDKERHA